MEIFLDLQFKISALTNFEPNNQVCKLIFVIASKGHVLTVYDLGATTNLLDIQYGSKSTIVRVNNRGLRISPCSLLSH